MSVSFPVTIPALFGIDYTFTVPEDLAKILELNDIADVLTLNVVNIPKGQPEFSTVNLLGPIVINIQNKNAIQMILQDSKPEYTVRYRLFKDGNPVNIKF
jgi:flagellar assembly factor FliW